MRYPGITRTLPFKKMVYSGTALMIALFGVLIRSLWQTWYAPSENAEPSPPTQIVQAQAAGPTTSTNARVTRVVDGDTFVFVADGSTGEEKVRMLGINTPESVDPRRSVQCFGREASAFAKRLLEGRRVRLEEDVQADNIDKYGRFLRNVILEDGRDVNLFLVQEGYAQAYLSFPLSKTRKAQIRQAEAQAKAEEKGLWNPNACPARTK